MPKVKTLEDLKRLKEEAIAKRKAQAASGQAIITIGMGTCGIAAGARDTKQAILDIIDTENLSNIVVAQTGCGGLCEWEPIVEVVIGREPKVAYGKISPERARQIVTEHIVGAKIIPEYVIPA